MDQLKYDVRPQGQKALVAYFVVAYAVSWMWMLPLVLNGSVILRGKGWPTHFPALLGPMVAAFIVAGWTQGRRGTHKLLGQMLRWCVGVKWWLWLGSPLVFLAIGILLTFESSGSLPSLIDFGRFNGLPEAGVFGVWTLLTLVNGFGEEAGWRGFALPALQGRFSPLAASLILAPLWALWHFPYFFTVETYRGFDSVGSMAGFLVGVSCGSLVLTWLYNRSGGSILIVALWHGTFNLATGSAAVEGTVAAVVSTAVVLQAIVLVVLELRSQRRGTPSILGPLRPSSSRRPRSLLGPLAT